MKYVGKITWNSELRNFEESLMTDLMSSKFCISYFKIQEFVDKTQTKFPEFKLEYFQRSLKKIL